MPFGELMTGMDSRCAELGQLRAGLGQRHAVADEDHRALGRQQHVDGSRRRRPARRRCAAS